MGQKSVKSSVCNLISRQYAKYRINNNEYNPTNTNGINDIILKILFLYLLVTQNIILNTLPTIQPSTNPLITASIISVSIIHIIPTIQIGETIERIAISGEKNFFTLSLLPNHNSIELYVQLHNFPIYNQPNFMWPVHLFLEFIFSLSMTGYWFNNIRLHQIGKKFRSA